MVGEKNNQHTMLRQRAEATLQTQPGALTIQPPEDIEGLIHELEVHQLELEMQNEELRRAQFDLEVVRDRYIDLFDFAPVGYFTISAKGMVEEANLTGANLIGLDRSTLVNQPFTRFVARESQDQYYLYCRRVLETETRQTCELSLVSKDGQPFFAQLEGVAMMDKIGEVNSFRLAVLNISERKQIEAEKALLLDEVKQQGQQLRALSRQLAQIQETERKDLARELHDQIGQNLSALSFNLDIIRARLTNDLPAADPIQDRFAVSQDLLEQTVELIRDVMAELRPPMLDDYGLLETLNWFADQSTKWMGLKVTVKGKTLSPRPAPFVENTLFRITQEALTNVAKHAQATQVTISVIADMHTLRLVIADDGVGFTPKCPTDAIRRQTWGILTMTERAEMIDGQCRVESQLNQGTQVIVEVPQGTQATVEVP